MTETPKSEIRPCPFCGEVPKHIEALDIHNCPGFYEFRDIKYWQNAYCWKELDAEKETKEEALKAIDVYQQRAFKAEKELDKAKAEIEELKNTMAIRELRCKEHERALLEGIKVREKKDVVLELAMNCLKHIRDNYDGSVYSNVTVVLSQIDEALK